jgi:ribosomal protein L11 methyltransferase
VALELRLLRSEVERVSALLFEMGALGLEEAFFPGETPAPRQPWDKGPAAPEPDRLILKAWFENADEQAIERDLSHLEPILLGPFRWEKVEERDWEEEWRAGFPPFEISGWTIAPPWELPKNTDQVLIIEPGQGFGTGRHESTRAALRHLLRLVEQGGLRTALDVGCGSGILALAAAKRGLQVCGIDVEPAAIKDAERNARHNDVEAEFSTTPLARVQGRWDLVLANLHAELLVELADELLRVTGQYIVMAGILLQKRASVQARFASLELVEEETDGEWLSLVYRRSGVYRRAR